MVDHDSPDSYEVRVERRLATIQAQMAIALTKVDRIEKDLRGGNGRGLHDRVTILETTTAKPAWPERVGMGLFAVAAAIGAVFARDKTGL